MKAYELQSHFGIDSLTLTERPEPQRSRARGRCC